MKNKEVHSIYIGMRRLDVIQGLLIKEYLPDGILKYVHIAMADRKMEWKDETIRECTMLISGKGSCSVLYKYDPLFFTGLLLFYFTNEPKHDYRFSFPLKQFHVKYYLGIKYY